MAGYIALTIRRRPRDAVRLRDLAALAAKARVPTVATNDVLYHAPERRLLQDVVTCIREKCTIDELGDRRERFFEACLARFQRIEVFLLPFEIGLQHSALALERRQLVAELACFLT